MHQNPGLRAAHDVRGLCALISFFVIVVTCGQKVTNIDRFRHSRYLFFFCLLVLFSFAVFFFFLILYQFRMPVG